MIHLHNSMQKDEEAIQQNGLKPIICKLVRRIKLTKTIVKSIIFNVHIAYIENVCYLMAKFWNVSFTSHVYFQ